MKFKKEAIRIAAMAVILLAVCLAPATKAEAKAKLSKSAVVLTGGKSATIKVKGTDKPVKWSVSNKKIASVKGGKITALKTGKTTVTARTGKSSLKCKVTVVGLNKTKVSLNKKGKTTLKAVNGKNTKWKSSNSSVASVSKKGVVTAKKAGTATITCTTNGKKLTCKVYVPYLTNVSITLAKGNSTKLTVKNAGQELSWTSGSKSVALVDSNGNVRGIKAGTAKITCKTGSAKMYATVKVVDPQNMLVKEAASLISNSYKFSVTMKGYPRDLTYIFYNQGSSRNKSSMTSPNLTKAVACHGCAASSTAALLSAFTGKAVTPVMVMESIEKTVAGNDAWLSNYSKSNANQRPLSLYGVSKILSYYGVPSSRVWKFTDAQAKAQIKEHLLTGNPVVVVVSKKNRATGKSSSLWTNGYHTMVLIGMTANNKVLVGDSVNRAAFGKSQRVKITTLDELIPYMFPCTKEKASFYWNAASSCGGYLLVNPR